MSIIVVSKIAVATMLLLVLSKVLLASLILRAIDAYCSAADPPLISNSTLYAGKPLVSGLWLALVTPATYEVGRHLIEGLKNPMVVRDSKALEAFPIRPVGFAEAISLAIAESKSPA